MLFWPLGSLSVCSLEMDPQVKIQLSDQDFLRLLLISIRNLIKKILKNAYVHKLDKKRQREYFISISSILYNLIFWLQ